MTLESTILCVDNTEFSRNGDFTPNRFGVQQDILQMLCRSKMRMNAENNVGLIAVAGKRPTLVNTLTSDTNKLLTGFAGLTYNGISNNFEISLRTAHLALKHRQSKNHRQRIVVLICSPLEESESSLIKLAKKLKKEKVNVDIINFGEDEVNLEKLSKFIDTLNGKNADPNNTNCHLLSIPSGGGIVDAVRNSVINGANPNSNSTAGNNNAGNDFGDLYVDPNIDADLALALRMSLEESRARQQAENQSTAIVPETITEEKEGEKDEKKQETGPSSTAIQPSNNTLEPMEDEDAELMKALEISLGVQGGEDDGGDDDENYETAAEDGDEQNTTDEAGFNEMTEEEQIAFAIQMSMQDAPDKSEEKDDEMKE